MNKSAVTIGIDVGTSSTKCLALDERGRILAESAQSYGVISPRPGWSEQAPLTWWRAGRLGVGKLLARDRSLRRRVVAIGLSGQMHGSVFLDDRGKPLGNALLWNDSRSAPQCASLEATLGRETLLRETNNVALPGFTAPKVAWVRENEPRRFEKIARLLLPKDYVRYRMTGELATDYGDASGTLLLDVVNRRWSERLIEAVGLSRDQLPALCEGTGVSGTLRPEVARAWHLPAGIPVVGGSGDQPAAAVGMGIVVEGLASVTIGTSGVVFASADRPVPNPAGVLQSFCHALPDKWCVFGCMLAAGGALEWARDVLFPDADFETMLSAARRCRPDEALPFFLPYVDGERCPHSDPSARACWIGLGRRHGRAELARAAVEGITFGLRDQLGLFETIGIRPTELRCAGGGAKSRFWQQLQSDAFGMPTSVVNTPNASALGAAMLAGIGAGIWGSAEEAAKRCIRPVSRLLPNETSRRSLDARYACHRTLYPALKEPFREMALIPGA